MSLKFAYAAGVGLAAILALTGAALAQNASSGVYSPAQVARGAELYAAKCARCHGPSMEGLDVAPPLTGPTFLSHWTGQPLAALSARVRTTMPIDKPGSLGQAATADVTAAMLDANGYPAGKTDLPPGAAAQGALLLDAPK